MPRRPLARIRLLWVALLTGWYALPGGAVVTQLVTTTGRAAILADDRANAFEQAKKAALREAVEQATGTLVTASTQVEDLALLADAIELQTTGFVRRYRVLSQGEEPGGTYQVTLEAEVDLGFLHQHLAASNLVIDAVGNPPVLCVGGEFLGEGRGEDLGWGVVAAELAQGLDQANPQFTLLDAGPVPLTDALAVARTRGAEVLLVGKAVVRYLPETRVPGGKALADLGIHSAAAQVEVRLQWVDTGEVIAVLKGKSRAAANTFEAAGRKAAAQGTAGLVPQVAKTLLKDWRQKAYGGRVLQIHVQGSAGQVQRFATLFPQRIAGIDQLQERAYADGEGRFDARARWEGYQVARQLSARGLGDLNAEILGVTGNTLHLKLSD